VTVETRSEHDFDIGATSDLNLRVSVANLVKVTFIRPEDQRIMLVLERNGTVRSEHNKYAVIARIKPFGGGVQIIDPGVLRGEIGEFNFDSHRSGVERDFRIFINPDNWDTVKRFCWHHLREQSEVLESSPRRELVEEFQDTIGTDIKPGQYLLKWSRVIVEDEPAITSNPRSVGSLTKRIYSIHEMKVLDAELITKLIESSDSCSDQDLCSAAEKDFLEGGRGRANAVLVLKKDQLVSFFQNLSQQKRSTQIRIWGHEQDGNVLAILDEVESKKYLDLSADFHPDSPVANEDVQKFA